MNNFDPIYDDGKCVLYQAECVSFMQSLPANSFDSIVTDPPYGLEFLGQEWDGANGFRRALNPVDIVGYFCQYGKWRGGDARYA